MQYKDFIISALTEASKIANNYFGKVSGVTKEGDNNQVLTKADIEVGQFLVRLVQQTFPNHNIIDEEAGVIDKNSSFTWVIDPIDGTSNFANGIPMCGIMIGLLENSIPIAGGIALPFFGKVYSAEKNRGAFLGNEKLHVTTEINLLHTLVAYHIDGHQENPKLTREETKLLAEIILHIRNLRIFETCYDTSLLVEGKIGAYLNKTSKIWDNVAPQIIVEEAGGIYTDFYGKPIDYTNSLERAAQNFTVCASSSVLHKQLQDVIHKNLK